MVGGGEAAKRSHNVLVLMRTPLGTQHLMSQTASLESTHIHVTAAPALVLTDKLTLTVLW